MSHSTCNRNRSLIIATLLGVIIVLIVAANARAQAIPMQPVEDRAGESTADRSRRAERMTPVVRVFQQASPAVVNLSTTRVVTVQNRMGVGGLFDEIFDLPFQPRQYSMHSVGSGFIIHSEGYIVTNAHVVDRASEIKAIFADGSELDATEIAVEVGETVSRDGYCFTDLLPLHST